MRRVLRRPCRGRAAVTAAALRWRSRSTGMHRRAGHTAPDDRRRPTWPTRCEVPPDRYVALGDSYTAAPLRPMPERAQACMRSKRNYPRLVVCPAREHRPRRRELLGRLRRRQPAGPRLGRLARLPDRPQAARRLRRPGVPGARLPQADAQLHLVGQPQGRPGPQHLPGRLPRPGQHRRLRPQRAAADRRLHQPGRRHQLDGDVLPEPDAHRPGAGPAQPRLRGHRHQVLRALPAHRRGHDQHRRRRPAASACGTRRTSSTTTS